ncbi:MAG TPA: stage II sporulation protein P [Candidatus Pullichristensenella excrementigallinarum]|uniref:Stage II sporulation protein P n=1 Tax=Candidatus Pullichristensenella excrementigallinarum TaxID=2840907 RepID=A0A9D1LBJ1_9FIRM|nr:stage II sporulation protein P [Candidatus Pullichristensenella excrementigallinarum]
MKRIVLLLVAAFVLICLPAVAEETDGDCLYTLLGPDGQMLTMRAGRMYEGDEYISSDDQLYRIVSVDDVNMTATAEHLGEAQIDPAASTAFHSLIASAASEKKIAMYSTHSDESYIPSDGDYSLEENAGIYDVGNSFKENLEKLGIEVEYSEETFLPHDAGAYRRSRRVAEELVKDGPDAIFDIHRDGVPAEQYETTVDGEETSMVRLFVGRSNPNSQANRAFAQEVKAAADEEYPGLIKDIYIGKGNYNQELYPQSLLLEFGTHEIDKELAINSTEYMAEVINEVVFGGSAKAEGKTSVPEEGKAVSSGIFWVIGIAVVAAVVYALASTGKFKSIWHKIKRSSSEITGGMFGEKPEKKK